MMKPGRKPRPIVDRLRDLSQINGGCIEWIGDKNRKGYGRIVVDGKKKLVHRISYEINVGEIPEGLFVLHRCDNPKCFNHEHLFLGTLKENSMDMIRKGRSPDLKGEKSGRAKLTWADVGELKKLRANGCSVSSLARKHKVDRRTIRFALRGETWGI